MPQIKKKMPLSGRPHSVIIEPCIIKVIAWFGENSLKPLTIFADKKADKTIAERQHTIDSRAIRGNGKACGFEFRISLFVHIN